MYPKHCITVKQYLTYNTGKNLCCVGVSFELHIIAIDWKPSMAKPGNDKQRR